MPVRRPDSANTDTASPDSIRTVATQSDLIDAYEDHRLTRVGTHKQDSLGDRDVIQAPR